MSKSKMNEAAAERIRKARGDKVRSRTRPVTSQRSLPSRDVPSYICAHRSSPQDGFTKRAAEAARRNDTDPSRSQSQRDQIQGWRGGGWSPTASKSSSSSEKRDWRLDLDWRVPNDQNGSQTGGQNGGDAGAGKK
jgi:hypothetical protein